MDYTHGVRVGLISASRPTLALGSQKLVPIPRTLRQDEHEQLVHLRKLEEANCVEIEEGFRERKPHTHVRLTEKGRAAFKAYIDAIGKLVGNY